jgi:hypothetical protein
VFGERLGDDPMDDGLNALWIKLFLFSKPCTTYERFTESLESAMRALE